MSAWCRSPAITGWRQGDGCASETERLQTHHWRGLLPKWLSGRRSYRARPGRAEEVDFDARHQDLLLRYLRVLPHAPLMLVTHIRGLEGRRPHSTLGRDRRPRECRRRHGLRPRRSGPRRSDAGRRAVRKLRGRTDPSQAFGGLKGGGWTRSSRYWRYRPVSGVAARFWKSVSKCISVFLRATWTSARWAEKMPSILPGRNSTKRPGQLS